MQYILYFPADVIVVYRLSFHATCASVIVIHCTNIIWFTCLDYIISTRFLSQFMSPGHVSDLSLHQFISSCWQSITLRDLLNIKYGLMYCSYNKIFDKNRFLITLYSLPYVSFSEKMIY